MICIAVNDVVSTQYDLVLYEIKNSFTTWFASRRFVGILSKDYVDELTLKITTKTNRTALTPLSNLNVEVRFDAEIPSKYVTIITSAPTTCQIFISPTCTV